MAAYLPGPALIANTTTDGDQFIGDVAKLASGGYVVVWTSRTAAEAPSMVFARAFDGDGRPTGSEVVVGAGASAAVTALADGGFVVATAQRAGQTSELDARVFDASGTPRTGAIILDSRVSGPIDAYSVVSRPTVTTLTDGRIAVAWTAADKAAAQQQPAYRTFAQILNGDGSVATSALQLGPTVTGGFGYMDIDLAPQIDGGFALVRARYDTAVAPSLILGAVDAGFVSADGSLKNGFVTLSTSVSGVSAATLPDGTLIVGYGSIFRTVSSDGALGAIHTPQSDYGGNLARGPVEVAALPDGNLLLTNQEAGSYVAGIYTPGGVKIGLSIKGADGAFVAALSQDSFADVRAVSMASKTAVDGADIVTRVVKAVAPTSDPDGTALVNDGFYLARNGDVAAAGQDPDQHYHLYGWREGRDPDLLFNTDAYRFANRDVAAAAIDPLEQYHLYGWKEGRDPSAAFDTTLYLNRNADVKAAGIDPFEHYLQYGRAEGREIFAAIGPKIEHGSFDAEYYLLANPDVAKAGIDPYQHYQAYGWKEGRNPNAAFDTKAYLSAYADVKAAGIDPLAHYDAYGWKEGRDPSALFDTTNYLKAYGDVAAAQIDPLTHYLQYGAVEGRLPFGDGALHG